VTCLSARVLLLIAILFSLTLTPPPELKGMAFYYNFAHRTFFGEKLPYPYRAFFKNFRPKLAFYLGWPSNIGWRFILGGGVYLFVFTNSSMTISIYAHVCPILLPAAKNPFSFFISKTKRRIKLTAGKNFFLFFSLFFLFRSRCKLPLPTIIHQLFIKFYSFHFIPNVSNYSAVHLK